MGLDHGPGCILLGSGPSLNRVDVHRVAGLASISFNRSYVAWEAWGFAPTLYACTDAILLESCADEVRALIAQHRGTQFYLTSVARDFGIVPSTNVSFFTVSVGERFSTDSATLTDFGNVGATSLQLLALLGYRRVAMAGVDARYIEDLAPAVLDAEGFLQSTNDPNHFFASYTRRRGYRPPLNYVRVLGQWPRVAAECARVNLSVRNASPGSALDCFPTAEFADAVEWAISG